MSDRKPLTNAQIQAKRAEAQTVVVTMHVGKAGVTEATVAELKAQLKRRKLVKVRLLTAADARGEAEALAAAAASTLVEVRGHTAVYWKS